MRWLKCQNPGCGKARLVATVEEAGEIHYCNRACEVQGKKAGRGTTPRAGVGSRSTTARSRRQMRELTEQVGGKTVPGSGAIPGRDGDHVAGDTMLEGKVTDGESFRLTRTDWEKIVGEAGRSGKRAALVLDLGPYRILMLPMAEALEVDEIRARLGMAARFE